MSVKRWSHVASKDGDFRTLIILDPAEPGYCEVVGEIIKPTHAAKIASAVNDYAAVEKLCQQQHEALEFINKRCAIYGPADAARAKIVAVSDKFAALFPKTGGAK